MGIVFIYQQSTTGIIVANFSGSYFSISLSLNVLLTLMIVARLILHRRNFRKALGTSDGSSGLYTAIIVMLVESYALYAVAYLLYIVFWAIGSQALATLSKVVGAVQVRSVSTFPRCTATLGYRYLIRSPTGYCSVSHHSAGCQAESNDERVDLREHRVDPVQEPRVSGR